MVYAEQQKLRDLTNPKIVSPMSATPMKFSLSELAGSLGDFGTIIPLIIAVGLVSDVNIAVRAPFLWYLVHSDRALLPARRSRLNP